MTKPYVRLATAADVVHLIDTGLRKADEHELMEAGETVSSALTDCYASTPDCRAVVADQKCVALFGVAPVSDIGIRQGLVWFLGNDGITQISREFLRQSKMWLEEISDGYDLLSNVVHRTNTIHVRWLEWLGFTFLSHRHGPFIEFVRIPQCAAPV